MRDSDTGIADETVTAEAARISDAARAALAQRDELANGFRFRPTNGRYVMRDYDPESLPRLQAAYRHLAILVTDYPDLVPGQLNRLVHQWRSDMWRGITAKTGTATDGADGPADQADEQPAPADRYIEVGVEFE